MGVCMRGSSGGGTNGGSCPDWGFQQGLLSFGQLFPTSKAGRRGSVKSYNNSELYHPFKTQLNWIGGNETQGKDRVSLLIQGRWKHTVLVPVLWEHIVYM